MTLLLFQYIYSSVKPIFATLSGQNFPYNLKKGATTADISVSLFLGIEEIATPASDNIFSSAVLHSAVPNMFLFLIHPQGEWLYPLYCLCGNIFFTGWKCSADRAAAPFPISCSLAGGQSGRNILTTQLECFIACRI